MYILFYGNCQSKAICKTLNLDEINMFNIECYKTDISKKCFDEMILKCDLIITQPICDNYRNKDYLSTSYIIKNARKNCKIIIFDSCYFDFYYFDLTYKKINDKPLGKPSDYHYNKMIECYKDNKSINYYIDNYVNNEKLKTKDELETIAENSLSKLRERNANNKKKYVGNNVFIISTYEYIKNNYKDKLLFYSMNHPTKYLLQFICEEIVNILKIKNTINYEIDVLASETKCIIYKCIQQNVNFDIKKHFPLTLQKKNVYEITELYYDTYSKKPMVSYQLPLFN